MRVSCDTCGTEFDAERETRGDPERCPSCGTPADVDAEPTPDDSDAGLACGLCGEPLPSMDHAADHLEDEHRVVRNAILANVDGIGGGA